MGTSSLVFGLVSIVAGLWVFYETSKATIPNNPEIGDDIEWIFNFVVVMFLTTPFLAVGGFLLRKFDIDRKEEI